MKTATAILALVMLAGCYPSVSVSLDDRPPSVASGADAGIPRADGYRGDRLEIYVDPVNGCEYLSSIGRGITPRLNPDGTQVCGGAP